MRWVRDHSLSLALGLVLLVQTVIYWFTGLADWRIEHPRGVIWPGYTTHFVSEMMVSTLADTYGAVILVLFSKWFFEKGSAESKE